MRCHEVDYEIHGDDMQIVEGELDPGEVVIAEAGAMNYMDDGISFEAKMMARISVRDQLIESSLMPQEQAAAERAKAACWAVWAT